MLQGVKQFFRRIFPASIASVSSRTDRLLEQQKASEQRVLHALQTNERHLMKRIEASDNRLSKTFGKMEKALNRVTRLEEKLIRMTEQGELRAKAHLAKTDVLLGLEKEAVWAHVFNNAITGSDWAANMPLWPGRFSVGYAYLFVLFRALTTLRPQRILDIGLGITTKFFEGYVGENPEAHHTVVEDNEEWISFFCNEEPLPPNTEMLHLPVSQIPYKEESALVYQGFAETLKGRKFDLISIDAPIGGKVNGMDRAYSRVDILSILPDCLAPSFVILVDDYHRTGEQHTVKEVEALLESHGIEAIGKAYEGTKKFYVLVSPDNGFLLTL